MATGDTFSPISYRVQTRENWTDEWSTVTYLVPLIITQSVGPSISAADFVYRWGVIKREDANQVVVEPALADTKGHFIRVQDTSGGEGNEVDLFYGVVVIESSRPFHEVNWNATDRPSGDLFITAFGLEYMLTGAPLLGTSVELQNGATTTIQQTLTFNERYERGLAEVGNRSETRLVQSTINGESYHVFSLREGDGFVWTAEQILQYELATANHSQVPFVLTGQLDALDAIVPKKFSDEGRSILSVLNDLADRRRGVTWSLDHPETRSINGADAEVVPIHIYSTFTTAVSTTGDGGEALTIPANDVQATLDVDGRHDIRELEFHLDAESRWDWAVVRGARVKTCFSVAVTDGTLVKGWTPQEEFDYTQAEPDERRHDIYNHIFQLYRIAEDWNWFNSDGDQQTAWPVSPDVDENGNLQVHTPSERKRWGHSLLAEIPSIESWSVTGTGNLIEDIEVEYRKPFAFVKDNEGNYQYVDQLDVVGFTPKYLRMINGGLGVLVTGGPNHTFGLNHSNIGDEEVDWNTLVCTLSLETDEVLQVVRQLRADAPAESTDGGDSTLIKGRILLIDIPDAELWYIVPGTVLESDRSTLFRSTSTEPVRTDAPRLRRIADLAESWYSRARQVVSFDMEGIDRDYQPGTVLKVQSGSWTRDDSVGSIVSSRTWDFERYTTTYRTDYRELDFQDF